MTSFAQKIVTVNTSAMMNDTLFRSMKSTPQAKVSAMLEAIKQAVSDRRDFDAKQERLIDGVPTVCGSADIKHAEALQDETVARFFCALKVDPSAYIAPMLQSGGKSSEETSNLKAYKKCYEIAHLIYTGVSKLETVARVFSVCAYRYTLRDAVTPLPRSYAECFLNSLDFTGISQGTDDFWSAIDDVRAKHMSGGAKTQASQMIRTLVALKSAKDVQSGRAKDVKIDAQGRVLLALMRRFGQVTDTVTHDDSEAA